MDLYLSVVCCCVHASFSHFFRSYRWSYVCIQDKVFCRIWGYCNICYSSGFLIHVWIPSRGTSIVLRSSLPPLFCPSSTVPSLKGGSSSSWVLFVLLRSDLLQGCPPFLAGLSPFISHIEVNEAITSFRPSTSNVWTRKHPAKWRTHPAMWHTVGVDRFAFHRRYVFVYLFVTVVSF